MQAGWAHRGSLALELLNAATVPRFHTGLVESGPSSMAGAHVAPTHPRANLGQVLFCWHCRECCRVGCPHRLGMRRCPYGCDLSPFGLVLLGLLTLLLCTLYNLNSEVPTWGTEVFKAQTHSHGFPEQRPAMREEKTCVPLSSALLQVVRRRVGPGRRRGTRLGAMAVSHRLRHPKARKVA